MIPSDKELDPEFLKHFKNVLTPNANKPAVIEPTLTSKDYNEPARNFWSTRSGEIVKAYDFGSNAGKFAASTSTLRIEDVFNTVLNALKTAVLNEIQQTGGNPRSYKDTLDAIVSLFNILIDKLKTTDGPTTEKNKIDAEKLLATIHGHLNSYIVNFYKNNKSNEIYKM